VIQARLRSTTHRRGRTTNPTVGSLHLTTWMVRRSLWRAESAQFAGVPAVGEDQADALAGGGPLVQQGPGSVPILHAGRSDQHADQQAQRVYRDVAFPAVDFLPASNPRLDRHTVATQRRGGAGRLTPQRVGREVTCEVVRRHTGAAASTPPSWRSSCRRHRITSNRMPTFRSKPTTASSNTGCARCAD
jgi:hypothetical protein